MPHQLPAGPFSSKQANKRTVPYDGDVEVVLRQALPGSMEKLSAPQISLALGVQVGLVGADQLLTVLLGVGLDLQGVLGHQQTQRHGGGRRNPVDKFGFHFDFSKTEINTLS